MSAPKNDLDKLMGSLKGRITSATLKPVEYHQFEQVRKDLLQKMQEQQAHRTRMDNLLNLYGAKLAADPNIPHEELDKIKAELIDILELMIDNIAYSGLLQARLSMR